MAISYSLGYEPIWLLMDENSTPAGGGYIVSWRQLNKAESKLIYQDPAGNEPFPNSGQSSVEGAYSIAFNMNGTSPGKGFYFEEDSSNLDETYFIQAFNAQGTLLWEVENYLPGGTGGGGNVTEFLPLKNYIANNTFINNVAPLTTTTSLTSLVVAPSNHQGFTPYTANPIVGTYGALGPDIMFLKNSTANTDSISFVPFTFGDALLSPDNTPPFYLNYTCTTDAPGETYKCFQFPITQKVVNLSNQLMTFSIWLATTSGTTAVSLNTRQYYGSGTGATAEALTTTYNQVGNTTASATWTQWTFSFTMPNVSGNTLGTPGLMTDDDAVYLQLALPTNTSCSLLFTKPALYLGEVIPTIDFETYDQVNSIDSTARCGDVKTSYLGTAPLGWLPMNDSTIGNSASGATYTGGHLFALYKTLWDNVGNAYAPVSSGRGATALADFLALKTLTMPLSLGRAMAGAGAGVGLTSRALGQNLGAQTISTAAMPAHTHPTLTPGKNFFTGTTGSGAFTSGGSISTITLDATTGSTGGGSGGQGASDGNMPPISFFNVYIKI